MDIWDKKDSKRILSVAEKLRLKVQKNSYFPFICVDETKKKRVFVLRVRDEKVRLYLIIAICSFVVALIFILTGQTASSYFLFPFGSLLMSSISAFSLREIREYVLHEAGKRYIFSIGNTVYTEDNYSNIYIRLRKRYDNGRAGYFLILNGYRIEMHMLCKVSSDVEALRSLGKEIACNLHLNYFDESNNSTKHVVRHFPKFKKISNIPSFRPSPTMTSGKTTSPKIAPEPAQI